MLLLQFPPFFLLPDISGLSTRQGIVKEHHKAS